MSLIAAGVTAAVAVGASVYSANQKGKALKKGMSVKQAAYDALQPLDFDELNKVATEADLLKYKTQLDEQAKVDPTFAKLRSQGGANLLSELQAGKDSASTRSVKEIEALTSGSKKSQEDAITALMDRAKADLEAGATLPPEFQAELIKAGLENAGNQGLSIEGRGAAGSEIRRLVGSEGLALKQQREANARENLSAAEMIRRRRLDALGSLINADTGVRDTNFNRAGKAIAVGQAMMPSIGLTGADAAGVSAANTEFENNRILAKAGVKAKYYADRAANRSQAASGVASGISSFAGAAGGGGGGGGSWITSLFSGGNQQPTTATRNEVARSMFG